MTFGQSIEPSPFNACATTSATSNGEHGYAAVALRGEPVEVIAVAVRVAADIAAEHGTTAANVDQIKRRFVLLLLDGVARLRRRDIEMDRRTRHRHGNDFGTAAQERPECQPDSQLVGTELQPARYLDPRLAQDSERPGQDQEAQVHPGDLALHRLGQLALDLSSDRRRIEDCRKDERRGNDQRHDRRREPC